MWINTKRQRTLNNQTSFSIFKIGIEEFLKYDGSFIESVFIFNNIQNKLIITKTVIAFLSSFYQIWLCIKQYKKIIKGKKKWPQ